MTILHALLLQAAGGIHFDATITLGNVLSMVVLALAAIKFWSAQVEVKKDLEWRISNLEKWRNEHMIDSDSKQKLVGDMGEILRKLQWVEEARQKQRDAIPGRRRISDL